MKITFKLILCLLLKYVLRLVFEVQQQACDGKFSNKCCWILKVLVAKLINLLKPTGHVMHQQFNIQQLYAQPTLYLCVLYLSENKQRLVQLTA